MVSVIPVGLIADAKKWNFANMNLKLVENSRMEPVHDVSVTRWSSGSSEAGVDLIGRQRWLFI